jgi:type I restriction enzyme R subunit
VVKHASNERKPLLTGIERVERDLHKLTAAQAFTPEQQQWLGRIRIHLVENLSIEREDFDLPVLTRDGGWGAAARRTLSDGSKR